MQTRFLVNYATRGHDVIWRQMQVWSNANTYASLYEADGLYVAGHARTYLNDIFIEIEIFTASERAFLDKSNDI